MEAVIAKLNDAYEAVKAKEAQQVATTRKLGNRESALNIREQEVDAKLANLQEREAAITPLENFAAAKKQLAADQELLAKDRAALEKEKADTIAWIQGEKQKIADARILVKKDADALKVAREGVDDEVKRRVEEVVKNLRKG